MPRNWKRKCPILNILLDVLSKYFLATLNLILKFDMFQTKHIMFFFKKTYNILFAITLYMYWRLIFAQTFSATDTYELQITTEFPSFLEVDYLFGI